LRAQRWIMVRAVGRVEGGAESKPDAQVGQH
jgi:hypothetical protein